MSLFKQKVSYQDFMKELVKIVLRTEDKDINQADVEGILSEAQKKKINEELHWLYLIITYFLISNEQRFGNIKSLNPREVDDETAGEELSRNFAVAIAQAMVDEGIDKKKGLKELDAFEPIFMDYVSALSEIEGQQVKEDDIFFHLINRFVYRVLGKVDLSKEEERDKQFQVFDIGKQVFRNMQKVFRDVMKKVSVI